MFDGMSAAAVERRAVQVKMSLSQWSERQMMPREMKASVKGLSRP